MVESLVGIKLYSLNNQRYFRELLDILFVNLTCTFQSKRPVKFGLSKIMPNCIIQLAYTMFQIIF